MRRALTGLCLLLALFAIGLGSTPALAASTPAQIADKAIAKMRAISASAVKSLEKQERKAIRPLRDVAAHGGPIEARQAKVLERSLKLGPIAEQACKKMIGERDKALGRLVALEGRASAAEIEAARVRLREERDTLKGLIGGRADTAAENLAHAAALDPGDRDELDSLIPNVSSPTCDVQAQQN